MQIKIPYGESYIVAEAEPDRVLLPRTDQLIPSTDGLEIVRRALENPIGSERLCELAKNKKTAVIIISDHTRPVPSKDILPLMLKELREGNPAIDITLLVATGCHRGSRENELRSKLGDAIFYQEKIVIHDCADEKNLVQIGTLPSGAPLIINRLAAETDLLVAEGFIEPHFFAGFSGGRKSVLPGVAARKTVLGNHCGKFIASDYARTGILENNPIHRDMDKAAEMAHLSFIVNVVINTAKETVAAFAGNFREAHRAGTDFLRSYCEVNPIPGDIVVTGNGGAPLDQNLYQCVKCMTAAEATVKPHGTIIVAAEANDGIGGDGFYHALADCRSIIKQFELFASTPQDQTMPDQWQAQILCRILSNHRVILITRKELARTIREMKMEYAGSLQEALRIAGEGEITWIPNGVSIIVKK